MNNSSNKAWLWIFWKWAICIPEGKTPQLLPFPCQQAQKYDNSRARRSWSKYLGSLGIPKGRWAWVSATHGSKSKGVVGYIGVPSLRCSPPLEQEGWAQYPLSLNSKVWAESPWKGGMAIPKKGMSGDDGMFTPSSPMSTGSSRGPPSGICPWICTWVPPCLLAADMWAQLVPHVAVGFCISCCLPM